MKIVTTVELSDSDAAVIDAAEKLREAMYALNACGSPLDRGLPPADGRPAGAYWHAQEAFRLTLSHLTGDPVMADRLWAECIDNGENVRYQLAQPQYWAEG